MGLTPQFDPQMAPAGGKAEKAAAVKLTAAQYIVALVMVILVTGLWRLQIVGADNFRALAEANRIRKVPVLAPRGRLFDREGRLLVDNYPSVSCFLLREQMKDLNADLPLISKGLHIPVEQIEATLKRYQSAPRYQPIPLKQDITPDEQAFYEAGLCRLHREERLYDNPAALEEVEANIARLERENAEIAEELHFGIGTIKLHVREILQKLGASTRTEAAVLAVRKGYI